MYVDDLAAGFSAEKISTSSTAYKWNDYIVAGGVRIAMHVTTVSGSSSSAANYYFVLDHLGSTAVIAGDDGAVIADGRLAYDPWGKRRYVNGSDDTAGSIRAATNRGFISHEHIDDVGLINMNARVYDPAIGRFMSADPVTATPYDAQSLNRYTYVDNRPLSLTDPTGMIIKNSQPNPNNGNWGEVTNFTSGWGSYKDEIAARDAFDYAEYAKDLWNVTIVGTNGGSTGKTDIWIGYTPAGTPGGSSIPGADHTVVVAGDPFGGEAYATRAGPNFGKDKKVGFFDILAEARPWKMSTDYGHVEKWQYVGSVNMSIARVSSHMRNFRDVTNDNHLVYGYPVQNSNSYSFSFVDRLGFKDVVPMRGVNPLGWWTNLPSESILHRLEV